MFNPEIVSTAGGRIGPPSAVINGSLPKPSRLTGEIADAFPIRKGVRFGKVCVRYLPPLRAVRYETAGNYKVWSGCSER